MNDAFQVWWYMIWRSALTGIAVFLVLNVIKSVAGIGSADPLSSVFSAISAITLIVVQIFYLKLAINRDYKEFRISTTAK